MVTNRLRIGTPALATRGFSEDAFREVADIIAEALTADAGTDLSGLRHRVETLAAAHPLYPSVAPLAG
jgi:glycine hydroxymethyltransferase